MRALVVLAALVAASAWWCGPALALAGSDAKPLDQWPWFNDSLPIPERVELLLTAMNITEKMSQLITDFTKPAVAIPRLGIPSYDYRSNMLHGLVDNGVSTVFVQAIGMAATWDYDLMFAAARVMSNEQRAKYNTVVNDTSPNVPMNYGLNVWGPNINIFRDPRFGRGQETYGECPYLSGKLGVAMIQGLQDGGHPGKPQLFATAKHFDAYDVDKTPPRLSFDPNITATDLYQTYFPHFEKAVRAGVGSIMCSYNGVNGYPMCASPMLQSVLRDEWGFDGFICSDSGAIEFFVTEQLFSPNLTWAAASAMNAGVDVCSGTGYYNLPDAYFNYSLITEEQITTAARRAFTFRFQVGLYDPRDKSPYASLGEKDIASPANMEVAKQVGRESIVLLKNDGGLLPLSPSKVRRIAVVGPNANSTYVLVGNYYGCQYNAGPLLPECVFVTPLDGIQSMAATYSINVTYTQGCDVESNDTTGFAQATQLALDADVTIAVMGLETCVDRAQTTFQNCESEGHDRENITFPGVQEQFLQALYATGKPIVLVLVNGGPVSSPWAAENIPAIVEAWYGGEPAGTVLAEMLFGNFSPSGRLPFTVPLESQLPDELDMSLSVAPGRTYRYLTETPVYAFGYGLSYTSFAYANMTVTPAVIAPVVGQNMTVCATVTNTGTVSGDEVVQVYAQYNVADRFQGVASVPLKQLIGFARTGVLAPGQAIEQCLVVSSDDIRLMSPNGSYGVQSGSYNVWIGGCAPGSRGLFVPDTPATSILQSSFQVQ